MTLSEYSSFQTASPKALGEVLYAGGNWNLETGNCRALHGRGDAPTVSRATHPSKPEPYYAPRPEASRCVCRVFQFIHSRSFDASGQNPVSRIASWGPQGAPSFQRGQIPDYKFQVLSVDQGPEYRFSSEPSGRGGWTRIQIPSSRGGLSHISKSEKTQVEEFPQGGSRI